MESSTRSMGQPAHRYCERGMKRLLVAVGLATAAGVPLLGSDLHAQSTDEPFELALFTPLQVRGPDSAIQILRLSLIYGENVSVKGLDISLVGRNTGGISKGLQYALVGYVEGDFVGWQDGYIAGIVEGDFKGLQGPAAYNRLETGEGVQLGLINQAAEMSGFQLGVVNFAESMYGLQNGLVNIIQDKTSISFLPIVNWSF